MRHAYVDTPFGQNYYETEGNGHPLILLHQVVFSSFEFLNVIPTLSRTYRAVALDMPGMGRSDPAPLHWKLEDFARNVVDVMSALGIERAHVAGHHTGAIVALEVAAAYPDRVNKLVLSGCATYYRNDVWKAKLAELRGLVIEKRCAMPFPAQPPFDLQWDGSHLMKVWNMQTRQNPDSDLAFVQKAFLAAVSHWDKRGGSVVLAQMEYDRELRAPLVKAPTLVLSGTKDVIRAPVFKPPDYITGLIPGAVHKWIEGGTLGVI